jgi:hypothetical protein
MLIAAYTPMARLRGDPSGNVVVARDSAVGATTAAPMPCNARAARSHSWVVASPPSSEASENTAIPATKTRRRPRMSPARPPSSSSPPKARAYALTSHSKPEPEKPSARWIGGSATLTMVESSTTISCAVAMTSRASPRGRPGSAGPACARAAMDRVPDMAGLLRNRLPAR